jgi:hypothetical protein
MLYFIVGEDELLTGTVTGAEALSSHIIFFSVLAGLFLFLAYFIRNYYLTKKITLE